MAKTHIKVEFPCGLRFEQNIICGIFQEFEISDLEDIECPLHGKNCKKGR